RRAYSSRTKGVSSVEPSSTTTQSDGATDCAATLSSVRRRYWTSSLQGEMSRYRREKFTCRNSWEEVTANYVPSITSRQPVSHNLKYLFSELEILYFNNGRSVETKSWSTSQRPRCSRTQP